MFHNPVFWIVIGALTALFAWVFWELQHASVDPRDVGPDIDIPRIPICYDGIMEDIDNYEIIKTWIPQKP